MFDMNAKFNTFYSSCVVLPQKVQDELYQKKELNIKRLKEGLKEYNRDNGTAYSVVETCVQGSVAMSTVVQNEDNDYDIDVAIVFNKSNLGDKGPQATRKIVADALKRKTKLFNVEPEIKTSCVRVRYSYGYHIDFAIFRRSYDKWNSCWIYEHAGLDWSERELKGLTEWFESQNSDSNGRLRKVIRLSKMFCNSRSSWINMPSGLIQTVLCDENLQDVYEREDEVFYYTMKKVVDRLETDSSVFAPIDKGRDLTPRKGDRQKILNWKNRLKSKLEDLDVLFKDDCTLRDAQQAWYGFFNHDYWNEQVPGIVENSLGVEQKSLVRPFVDTEQFIEDMYPVDIKYCCSVSCHLSGKGLNSVQLSQYLTKWRWYIPHNLRVRCVMVYTDCPKPYTIFWKVKNVGPEAERWNQIRGNIRERGTAIEEPTSFYGNHYIECYIVKNGVCVAKRRIDIPIGRK